MTRRVISKQADGWVVGILLIIMPLHGPSDQIRTDSAKAEMSDGPSVAKLCVCKVGWGKSQVGLGIGLGSAFG